MKKNVYNLVCARWLMIVALWNTGTLCAERVTSIHSPAFSTDEILKIQKTLGVEIGGELDLGKINKGIRDLYVSQSQRLIFVELEKRADGVALIIRGTRFKKLKELKFIGVMEDVEEEIVRSGDFDVGKSIDLGRLSALREKIKEEYQSRGYPFASVEVDQDDQDVVTIKVVQNLPILVSQVVFSGVTSSEAKDLYDHIPLKRGAVYSKKGVEESAEALRKYFQRNRRTTSRVEETGAKFSEDRTRVEVSFQVRLGERYQFEFIGNREFEEVELRLLLTEEGISQADAMVRIGEQIEKKYRKAGFHFVRVDTKTENIADRKIQIVRFYIDEGKRVIVDRILFNGANALKESQLASLFFETAPGVLGRGLYWEEGVSEATARLRAKLESLGFLSASLTGPRTAFSEDRKGVDLIYDADLGNQTHFRKVEIRGKPNVAPANLLTDLPHKSGDSVSWDRVQEIKKAVLTKYRSEGYVDVSIEEEGEKKGLVLSPDQRDGDLILTIKEGRQYRVGSVTIEGNKRTKEKVILREVTLKPGDVFDPQKLKESEENVAVLQLFSRVEFVTYPDSLDPSRKNIKVIVVEIKPGTGEIGLGGSYEEPRFRARSFVGLQYRNLGGLNQTASQRTELTIPLSHQQDLIPFIEYAVTLGYRAPYLFELPFTFSAQAGLDAYEISPLSGTPVLQTRARIEERIEKRLSRRITGIYRLHRYERTTVEQLTVSPSPDSKSIGSTGPGLIVDFRDDSFNPTKGSYHTLDLEFAHPALLSQSDIGFTMVILRNSFYFPLSGGLGLILYAGGGYAKSIFDSPLPLTRLANDLSLGGQSSLRGYSSKEYQPNVDYDNPELNPRETGYLNGRIELGMPLLDNVAGAIFFDSGQLYPNRVPSGRKDGLGVGFRYKTPVGPVVIDVAHGFESREKNVKFTFTIGSI